VRIFIFLKKPGEFLLAGLFPFFRAIFSITWYQLRAAKRLATRFMPRIDRKKKMKRSLYAVVFLASFCALAGLASGCASSPSVEADAKPETNAAPAAEAQQKPQAQTELLMLNMTVEENGEVVTAPRVHTLSGGPFALEFSSQDEAGKRAEYVKMAMTGVVEGQTIKFSGTLRGLVYQKEKLNLQIDRETIAGEPVTIEFKFNQTDYTITIMPTIGTLKKS
jgi:hypothetical protein